MPRRWSDRRQGMSLTSHRPPSTAARQSQRADVPHTPDEGERSRQTRGRFLQTHHSGCDVRGQRASRWPSMVPNGGDTRPESGRRRPRPRRSAGPAWRRLDRSSKVWSLSSTAGAKVVVVQQPARASRCSTPGIPETRGATSASRVSSWLLPPSTNQLIGRRSNHERVPRRGCTRRSRTGGQHQLHSISSTLAYRRAAPQRLLIKWAPRRRKHDI